jgi:hypothetical protein
LIKVTIVEIYHAVNIKAAAVMVNGAGIVTLRRHSGALAPLRERTRNPEAISASGFRVRAEEARPGMTCV